MYSTSRDDSWFRLGYFDSPFTGSSFSGEPVLITRGKGKRQRKLEHWPTSLVFKKLLSIVVFLLHP
jgi:hypothetical protein